MKIFSYLLALMTLLLCLASCYEIEDLEQTYKDQYIPTEFTNFEYATHYSDQTTFMRLRFNVTHYKDGAKLMLHYTDAEGVYPFQAGDSIDITSLLADHPHGESAYGFNYDLQNLMPETRYWAGISYRDPGCKTVCTKVVNFTTEGLAKRCDCYDYRQDYMVVHAIFARIPSDCNYGCLISTESNLTLDHCMESREVGHHAIGDNQEVFKERFEGLQAETTYYYRAYVIYRGRTYYSEVYERAPWHDWWQ